jgi:FixJ family two-component response regulator
MSDIKQNMLGSNALAPVRPMGSRSANANASANRSANPTANSNVLARFHKVLIVDDDVPLRRTLARFFRAAQLEVTEAKSVAEGVLRLSEGPGLVITDVRLPDGTGRRVVEMASLRRPAPVIVAMSGLASAREAFALARSGARVYLTKPFAERELLDGISDHCHDAQRPHQTAVFERETDLDSSLSVFAHRYGVPEREMALVRLATAGVPRNRCPDMLGISENTCKTLTRRLLQRCGARSLAQIPRVVLMGEDQSTSA